MATTGESLAELWRYRYLLQMLVRRELKVRYKNSALGLVWSIIPPILQVFVYTFLFKGVLQISIPNWAPYLLCGLIPWTFFSTAILDASQSLLANYGIIKKVYMPREVIPLAIVLSNTIHFFISWAVFFVAFALIAPFFGKGIPLLPTMLLFPMICVMQILLTTGFALFLSAANVFFEDVKFIVMTLLNLVLFVLPILYPADIARDWGVMQRYPWLLKLYMLNPATAIIDAYRKTLLEPWSRSLFTKKYVMLPNGHTVLKPPVPLDWTSLTGAFLITLLIAYAGYWYFNRRKWQFVERS
jgi:lipopolysaccharide transport system permease protein